MLNKILSRAIYFLCLIVVLSGSFAADFTTNPLIGFHSTHASHHRDTRSNGDFSDSDVTEGTIVGTTVVGTPCQSSVVDVMDGIQIIRDITRTQRTAAQTIQRVQSAHSNEERLAAYLSQHLNNRFSVEDLISNWTEALQVVVQQDPDTSLQRLQIILHYFKLRFTLENGGSLLKCLMSQPQDTWEHLAYFTRMLITPTMVDLDICEIMDAVIAIPAERRLAHVFAIYCEIDVNVTDPLFKMTLLGLLRDSEPFYARSCEKSQSDPTPYKYLCLDHFPIRSGVTFIRQISPETCHLLHVYCKTPNFDTNVDISSSSTEVTYNFAQFCTHLNLDQHPFQKLAFIKKLSGMMIHAQVYPYRRIVGIYANLAANRHIASWEPYVHREIEQSNAEVPRFEEESNRRLQQKQETCCCW